MIDHENVTDPSALPADVTMDVGNLIEALALDVLEDLHSVLGVPRPGDGRRTVDLFRRVVEDADKPRFSKYIYPTFLERLRNPRDDDERRLLEWTAQAYTGSPRANPELAAWDRIWLEIRNRRRDGSFVLPPEEGAALDAFIALVGEEADLSGFRELREEVYDRPVETAWDREAFMRHGWVPGDDDGGADPTLILEAVNAGEGFRRALAKFDFDAHPAFPFEKVRQFGQDFYDEHRIWLYDAYPDQGRFPDLRDVR